MEGHHHDDRNLAETHFPPGTNYCCLNCGQKFLISLNDNNEASIGAGVVAFTSFLKNEKAQVFITSAVKEVYSILHGIELENDLENCALCVDCALVFAQLFGLFQTFESRRKADGLLGISLTKGIRWASEFKKSQVASYGLRTEF